MHCRERCTSTCTSGEHADVYEYVYEYVYGYEHVYDPGKRGAGLLTSPACERNEGMPQGCGRCA